MTIFVRMTLLVAAVILTLMALVALLKLLFVAGLIAAVLIAGALVVRFAGRLTQRRRVTTLTARR